jgi:WD40 repeat protein
MTSDAESVCIWDAEQGAKHKQLRATQQGISVAKFMHAGAMSCIVGSGKTNLMRHWDLYENKIVRNFQAHEGPVCSMDVHPYEDMVLSGSVDRTAMLWDFRKERPLGKMPIFAEGTKDFSAIFAPAVCFDNLGMVFALSSGGTRIHLFDTRNFEKAEFAHFDFSSIALSPIKFMKFSPCGKFILVTCSDGSIFTVDSFKGELLAKYPASAEAEPVFSPDSNIVACGSHDGLINFYNTLDGKKLTHLKGHTGFPRILKFNPQRAQLLSASIPVALWNLPRSHF